MRGQEREKHFWRKGQSGDKISDLMKNQAKNSSCEIVCLCQWIKGICEGRL